MSDHSGDEWNELRRLRDQLSSELSDTSSEPEVAKEVPHNAAWSTPQERYGNNYICQQCGIPVDDNMGELGKTRFRMPLCRKHFYDLRKMI